MRISDWSSDVCSSDLQGGRRNRGWRVRFKARWAPTIDPLTGWTGGGDPLETIELRFPDRESAENYCAREGLAFRCVRHSSRLPNGPRLPADPAPMLCCWPSGPHRSEEHTSELQSLMRISYAVFCLKKKKYKTSL